MKQKVSKLCLEARPEIYRLEEAFGKVKKKYIVIREVHDEITELMVEAEIESTKLYQSRQFYYGNRSKIWRFAR